MRRAVVLLVVASTSSAWGVAVGAGSSSGVQLRVLRFLDRSRLAHFRNGTSGPRVLVTEVRYPTRGHAPFPLLVFAHGFAETPDAYPRMLDT